MKVGRVTDMSKLKIGVAIAVGLCAIAVSAEEKISLGAPLVATSGTTVTPIGELEVFKASPSSWFGNAFNSELGTVGVSDKFQVIDFKEIGSFEGPQVWVQLAPVDGSDACGTGCWAYLGAKSSVAAEVESSMEPETPGEGRLIEYGNFVFSNDPST